MFECPDEEKIAEEGGMTGRLIPQPESEMYRAREVVSHLAFLIEASKFGDQSGDEKRHYKKGRKTWDYGPDGKFMYPVQDEESDESESSDQEARK